MAFVQTVKMYEGKRGRMQYLCHFPRRKNGIQGKNAY